MVSLWSLCLSTFCGPLHLTSSRLLYHSLSVQSAFIYFLLVCCQFPVSFQPYTLLILNANPALCLQVHIPEQSQLHWTHCAHWYFLILVEEPLPGCLSCSYLPVVLSRYLCRWLTVHSSRPGSPLGGQWREGFFRGLSESSVRHPSSRSEV